MPRLAALALTLLLATALPGLAAPPDAPARLVVGFDHVVGEADASRLAASGALVERVVPNADFVVVSVERASAFRAALGHVAGVRYVEADAPVFLEAPPNDMYWNPVPVVSPGQWGPAAIQAPAAWDVEDGSDQVIYGVVDTGVDYLHPDLLQGMWLNDDQAGDGVDNDGNGYVDDFIGWDCTDHDNDPNGYEQAHGSHVAGIAAARKDNVFGIAGVAQVRIMALKVIGGGTPVASAAAECIRYGADNGARVLGMSWFTTPSTALTEAIQYAWAKNVVLVKSAGNQNGGAVTYPGTLPEVIAVSALNPPGNTLASYSSVGAKVELAAPGTGILSTVPVTGVNAGPTPFHAVFSGTSMAQPHASGVAALILSKNPALTNQQVRDLLCATADDLGAPGRDPQFGCGRVNALAAVNAAGP